MTSADGTQSISIEFRPDLAAISTFSTPLSYIKLDYTVHTSKAKTQSMHYNSLRVVNFWSIRG